MFTTIVTVLVVIVIFIILFKVFKLLMRLLLVAVFLLLAFITNPDLEAHQEAVARKENLNHVKVGLIDIDDYYVFSLTKVTTPDSRIIGAGAFTQVVIFGSLE